MRKHRLHGVVIAALLGTSFLHQRPSSHHPHTASTDLGRAGIRLASAALPADRHISSLTPGEQSSTGPSGVAGANLDRLGIRLASAAQPANPPHISLTSGEQSSAVLLRPVRTRFMKAVWALVAYEKAHTPPPPPPPPAPTPHPVAPPNPPATRAATGDVWAGLRQCESGGNYADNTGNGYYGAYQFSAATWHGLGFSGLPSTAPPAVQDQAAQRLQARSGWGQWPSCSRRLRLT